MSRKEGVEIMTRHIEEEYINSHIRLLANALHALFENISTREPNRNMIKLKSLSHSHYSVLQHFTQHLDLKFKHSYI